MFSDLKIFNLHIYFISVLHIFNLLYRIAYI